MTYNKTHFFKMIDIDDHLNSRTKEAYWEFFTTKCQQDIKRFYQEGNAVFKGEEGLHQYVQYSIDKFFGPEEQESGLPKPPSKSKKSKISPIDKEWKKKSAITWGWNDDVKGK